MPNGYLTRRPALALLSTIAGMLGGALLLASAGVHPAAAQSPPNAPSSVNISRAVGSVTVTWSAVAGASGYNVNLSHNGANSWTRAASGRTGTSATIASGIVDGWEYIAAVQAINSQGGGAWTSSGSVAGMDAPDAPTGVTATRSGTGISVSWTAPADGGSTAISGYDVNYSTDRGYSWNRALSGVTGTSATITSVYNSFDYVIAVRANNSVGGGAWAHSEAVAGLDAPSSVNISRAVGSVTVTWSAVAGASGYNVNLSHNGANSWTRAASGRTGTSATIASGIVDGWEYIAAVQAINSQGGGKWRNSDTVAGIHPPGAPAAVTAMRSGTGISVSWTAPGGNGGLAVTGYDVNYSTDGAVSWTRALSGTTGTSTTINNAANSVDYVIAVRASNALGGGVWGRATVAGLGAPAYVTAFRNAEAGITDAGWTTVAGATGYDVNLIFNATWHYNIANDVTGTTQRIWDNSPYGGSMFVVGVRARNEHGPGPWKNSATAEEARTLTASSITKTSATLTLAAYASTWYYKADKAPHNTCSSAQTGLTAALSGLTPGTEYTYTTYRDSSCETEIADGNTFTTAGPILKASGISNTGATLTLTGHVGSWYYKASSGPHTTCSTAQSQGVAATLSGLTPGSTYTYSAYRYSGCSGWIVTASGFTTLGPTLSSSNVTGTTATLTIGNHTAAWYYKADKAPHTTCQGPVSANDSDVDLTGLSSGTSYTYSAYSDSGCATLLTTAKAFTTAVVKALTVSGITATGATLTLTGHVGSWYYKASSGPHTTCSTAQSQGVAATLSGLTPGSTYTYSAYRYSGCSGWIVTASGFTTLGPTLSSSNVTGTTATLTIGNHTAAWYYKADKAPHTTCQGPVSANDSDVDLTGLSSGTSYTYSAYSDSGCATLLTTAKAFTTAVVKALTVSGITATGATLTLTGHVGSWYYKASSGPHTTCSTAQSQGVAATLSGLTPGSTYTYSAYRYSGCSGWIVTASGFTTLGPTLSSSNVTGTTATLTIGNHTAAWYYKADKAPHTTCQGPVSANDSDVDLTGLSSGTSYTYSAYSDSGCATLLTTAKAFTTAVVKALTVSGITATGATLTLTGHVGSWYYKASSGPHTTCSTAQSQGVAATLSGLTPGSTYTYSAYRYSGCSGWIVTASGFTTLGPTLSSSNVTGTTATLTIGNHTAAWYYKADKAPHTTCQGPVSANDSDVDLTGLSSGTSYTYSAYSDSGCATLLTTAKAFTTAVVKALTVSGITATGATLTLTGHVGSWYYKASSGPHTTCSTAQSQGVAATLSGLTPGSTYTYSAYRYSGCSGWIVTASGFTTLTAGGNTLSGYRYY